jgi:retron-type reverse transcriptase
VLEAYYEPQFRQHSHGLRPPRGGQTAFGDITKHGRGVKGFIEGDITQWFDRLNPAGLRSILGEKIHDHRFVRLMSPMLKAGYREEWTSNATLSGTLPGGVSSPLLSNRYRDLLDQFVEKVLRPAHNHGERRNPYPPYLALLRAARRHADKEASAHAQLLRQPAQQLPARDPTAPDFRRLGSVR